MKTDRNILIAFILNFAFSLFEFFGGIFTGSIAILSDAVHDIGDAVGIGISYFLEKKSKRKADETYTYGYARYSVLGSVMITSLLLVSSLVVIFNAMERMMKPSPIDYNGMILFAVVGFFVNLGAAFFTRDGESLNQKAVNLHMLEDVLGWAVVLIGAVIMRFTDFALIDPLMSIGVAGFILVNALRNLKEAMDLFLEKTPEGIDLKEIKEHVTEIDGVIDVHHIHLWSMDGRCHFATMHVVTNSDFHPIKEKIREELMEHGIGHVTIETEWEGERCHEENCSLEIHKTTCCHHHHH